MSVDLAICHTVAVSSVPGGPERTIGARKGSASIRSCSRKGRAGGDGVTSCSR